MQLYIICYVPPLLSITDPTTFELVQVVVVQLLQCIKPKKYLMYDFIFSDLYHFRMNAQIKSNYSCGIK